MLLFPRYLGVGGSMALCHAPVSRRTRSQAHYAVRYTWQAPSGPWLPPGYSDSQKGGLRDWYVE